LWILVRIQKSLMQKVARAGHTFVGLRQVVIGIREPFRFYDNDSIPLRKLYLRSQHCNFMTMLLEKAFGEAQKLDPPDQDALAAIIMEEMLAEHKWEDAFARSQDKLSFLADEAL